MTMNVYRDYSSLSCKTKSIFIVLVVVVVEAIVALVQGGPNKRGTLLLSISSTIIDRFSKFFHCHTLQTICNNVIITYPTTL